MGKYLLFMIAFSISFLNISGCSSKESHSDYFNTEANPIQTSTPDSSANIPQSVGFNSDDYHLLDGDDDTMYAWKFVGDDCVLYSLDRKNLNKKPIATFSPSDYETGNIQNFIVNFGICGDWIIASVGHYEGTGHYFYGDFVRLKKDGEELSHFWLTDDDTFVIIDDWIYYNSWSYKDSAVGCYRIRPDGTDKQDLGSTLYSIYLYAEDGYIYGTQVTDESVNNLNPVINLIRCKPNTSSVITLFKGNTLPKFDNSDFIEYYDINIDSNYVFFTVAVHGYTEGDSWDGHNIYTASYRVDSNGANLKLLQEKL